MRQLLHWQRLHGQHRLPAAARLRSHALEKWLAACKLGSRGHVPWPPRSTCFVTPHPRASHSFVLSLPASTVQPRSWGNKQTLLLLNTCGFHADDLDVRLERLDIRGNARHQAAAA